MKKNQLILPLETTGNFVFYQACFYILRGKFWTIILPNLNECAEKDANQRAVDHPKILKFQATEV